MINGFTSVDPLENAVALFRIKVINNSVDNPLYSYLGTDGIYRICIVSGNKATMNMHDVCIMFSTESETSKNPNVVVYDPQRDIIRPYYDYKIVVKADGYAYFFVRGKMQYDKYSYYIDNAEREQDIDCLIKDNITIPGSQFDSLSVGGEILQIVNYTARNDALLTQYGSSNVNATGTDMHIAKVRQLSGDVISIIGEVATTATGKIKSGEAFRRLPVSIVRSVIFVDVLIGRYNTLSGDIETIDSNVYRVPVRVNGYNIYAMCEIPSNAIISFNNLLYLSDVVNNNY